MINTSHVVGFYEDIFGNEIDEYEQTERYTLSYEGVLFEGDSEGFNCHDIDSWNDAIAIYDAYPNMRISIIDNLYDVTFVDGEWR